MSEGQSPRCSQCEGCGYIDNEHLCLRCGGWGDDQPPKPRPLVCFRCADTVAGLRAELARMKAERDRYRVAILCQELKRSNLTPAHKHWASCVRAAAADQYGQAWADEHFPEKP